jgi:8-oxo-dGTP diphosphatase
MAHRDGDGFMLCDCGREHWGLHGAAGLLLVRTDMNPPHVLLQLRAGWTHGGGTWAVPGGARDSHEDIVTAAIREAREEVGVDSTRMEVRHVFADDHGSWRYDTVIAFTKDDAGVYAANTLGSARRCGNVRPAPWFGRQLARNCFACAR